MGRNQLQKQITAEDIFNLTNNGYDIFQRELSNFKMNRNISSPFHIDKSPSFRIKQSSKSNLYIGVDYTTGKVYNGITLVQNLYSLTYKQAILKIANDFNLTKSKIKTNRIIIPDKPIIENKPILYEFTEIPFTEKHHAYWNAGELTEDFLKKHHIYAASHISINENVTKIPENELCFIYVAVDRPYGELKILRIGDTVTKENKWRTNIPNNYLWNLYEYKEQKLPYLWIIKSRKDEMIAKLLGINSVSTQSENEFIFIENYPILKEITPNLIINFGSDPDGVQKTQQIIQTCNIKSYQTPEYCLPEVNDLFSFVCKFGLRKLERHIQSKWNTLNPGLS